MPVRPARSNPDALVFDLDGTLWDTCETCAIAWNTVAARNAVAFRPIVAADVRGVTGLPHSECIRTVFAGVSERELQILIKETMSEDNLAVASRGGELYPGVLAGLRALSTAHHLFIVSNCQAGYIEAFLGFTGLGDVFGDHECWGNTGRSKAHNLAALIARNDLASVHMIGDTAGDAAAAAACGVPFGFARWGFGQCPEASLSFASFEALVQHYDARR